MERVGQSVQRIRSPTVPRLTPQIRAGISCILQHEVRVGRRPLGLCQCSADRNMNPVDARRIDRLSPSQKWDLAFLCMLQRAEREREFVERGCRGLSRARERRVDSCRCVAPFYRRSEWRERPVFCCSATMGISRLVLHPPSVWMPSSIE